MYEYTDAEAEAVRSGVAGKEDVVLGDDAARQMSSKVCGRDSDRINLPTGDVEPRFCRECIAGLNRAFAMDLIRVRTGFFFSRDAGEGVRSERR